MFACNIYDGCNFLRFIIVPIDKKINFISLVHWFYNCITVSYTHLTLPTTERV